MIVEDRHAEIVEIRPDRIILREKGGVEDYLLPCEIPYHLREHVSVGARVRRVRILWTEALWYWAVANIDEKIPETA